MDGTTGDFAIFEAMFMSLRLLLAAGKRANRFLVPPLPTASGSGRFLRFPRVLFLSVCATEYRSDVMKERTPLACGRREVS
ncbi:hypothetical protein GCM10007919_22780 [Rhizobium indigoferae]|nr:hypothetical protein GCM10007919_22780 [Rhizobium indigoferae]